MTMQFNFHSLANNQDYSCIEYNNNDILVNENPSAVKNENMFLFDLGDNNNYIQIVGYQRDHRVDQKQVHSCPVHVDKSLRAPFNLDNKSEDIMGNFARIYKNKGQYNGVLFTTSPGLPCIFAIPETVKGLHKTPTDRGVSTMTLQEDEYQKELYHKGELHKIHEKLQQHHRDKNINDSTMNIIRRMILPNRNL